MNFNIDIPTHFCMGLPHMCEIYKFSYSSIGEKSKYEKFRYSLLRGRTFLIIIICHLDDQSIIINLFFIPDTDLILSVFALSFSRILIYLLFLAFQRFVVLGSYLFLIFIAFFLLIFYVSSHPSTSTKSAFLSTSYTSHMRSIMTVVIN